ncbi:MAG: reductive dehalogenase domain-containing protein [Pseudomonadota bacterium]
MTKLKNPPPPPDYPFAYQTLPKRSGNEINGLGVKKHFRPQQVFHNTGRGAGREDIDWAAMDMFFNLTNPWPMFWENLKAWWERRHAAGPVEGEPIVVEDPKAMAERIKAKAREIGIELVGITHYEEDSQLEGISFPYKYAICCGSVMEREEMLHVPYTRGAAEVMRTYRRSSQLANKLAAHIRTLGWQAEAYGIGEDIMQIPMAINAGIGQLGKHGSMISKDYGSNFRLTCVLTDLPMAVDAPVDIGVDDLCATCQRCVQDCPPAAIFNEKQLVRGVKKWYVDFDKCIPYFTHTHGCAICIEVCPWSEPGRGPLLSKKLLSKRSPEARQSAAE